MRTHDMSRIAATLTCCIYVLLLANGCSKDAVAGQGDQAAAGVAGGAIPTAGTQATSGGGTGAISTAGANSVTPRAGTGSTATAGASGAGGIGPDGVPSPTAGTGGAPAADTGGTPPPDDGTMMVTDCALPEPMGAGTARAIVVDAAQVSGMIRSLQGAHWDPGPASGALSKAYKDIGVDMIRTHDAGGIQGSGCGDVDGPGRGKIVPNLSADPASESSYSFATTDTMIKNIVDTGAEVFFRVGRSNISGSGTVPPDFAKYAEFVKHIVMHYNKGWANGFQYGIKWWEIWNEPDFTPFWSGTGAQYLELYGKIARAIKEADSEVLIGGPANASFNDMRSTRGSLMKYVVDNKLPLDFFSFHKYTNHTNDPYEFKRMAEDLIAELAKYELTKTVIVNSEFWTSLVGESVIGGEAGQAAFLAQSLIYQQPVVAKSMHYGRVGSGQTKLNEAFSQVSKMNATPRKLCHKTQAGEDNGFAVMAGRGESAHKLQVAIASYHVPANLMGPSVLEEDISVTIMSYLPRRTIMYPSTMGYELTIKNIPDSWGDVTVETYRVDSANTNKMLSTKTVKASERMQGSLTVQGAAWGATQGAEQGVDLVVVTGQ
jgi:hypothetical protein